MAYTRNFDELKAVVQYLSFTFKYKYLTFTKNFGATTLRLSVRFTGQNIFVISKTP